MSRYSIGYGIKIRVIPHRIADGMHPFRFAVAVELNCRGYYRRFEILAKGKQNGFTGVDAENILMDKAIKYCNSLRPATILAECHSSDDDSDMPMQIAYEAIHCDIHGIIREE